MYVCILYIVYTYLVTCNMYAGHMWVRGRVLAASRMYVCMYAYTYLVTYNIYIYIQVTCGFADAYWQQVECMYVYMYIVYTYLVT
jgi:hypothetical protein